MRAAALSPDGKLVTLLRGRAENSRQLDLWAYDAGTGEARVLVSSTELVTEPAEMSEEEKNRRERQRIYDNGITAYQWDQQGRRIAFPLGGDVFLYDLERKAATRVTQSDGYETDVKFSPNGGFVAYVRDDELYAYDIATNKERKITSGAGGAIRNAVAEFAAQEELDRDTGYWISPDDRLIAFAQVDESPIPLMSRLDINADGVTTVEQRYPFAGKANAIVKLAIVASAGGKPRFVDLGADKDFYLARVHWAQDGSALYVERLSRDQKRLDVLKVDPPALKKAGAARVDGVELEVNARPAPGLDLSLVAAYSDARLTEDQPPISADPDDPARGLDGDPINNVPDLTFAASAQYEWSWAANLTGFARVDYSYTDGSNTTISPRNPFNVPLDSYDLVNLQFGVRSESWRVTVYAENLTDERPQNDAINDFTNILAFVTSRPRTIGVRAGYRF